MFVKCFKLIWVPRVLAILFVMFISMFALDAFAEDAPFIQNMLGFLIHLIPSFILLIVLLISWRRPLVAGWVFILLGVVFTFQFHTYQQHPAVFIIFLGVPLLIGTLFMIAGRHPGERNKEPV